MECRQKRSHTVNKQNSVNESRTNRGSFRIRKKAKQKATQTEDISYSSSTSTSASSDSCTSSTEDEQVHTSSSAHDKANLGYWNSRKPTSWKHRKHIFSDSNEEYYYTHPPSPPNSQPFATTVNPHAQQLIPRGPLICSDNFEKWGDRTFTWNRPSTTVTVLSSAPSNSTGTSESTTSIATTATKIETSSQDQLDKETISYGQASFFEGDVTDDDEISQYTEPKVNRNRLNVHSKQKPIKPDRKGMDIFTPTTMGSSHDEPDEDTGFTIDEIQQSVRSSTNFGSSQNLFPRRLSLTESLHSLPSRAEQMQNEIFERLRQAEEVS